MIMPSFLWIQIWVESHYCSIQCATSLYHRNFMGCVAQETLTHISPSGESSRKKKRQGHPGNCFGDLKLKDKTIVRSSGGKDWKLNKYQWDHPVCVEVPKESQPLPLRDRQSSGVCLYSSLGLTDASLKCLGKDKMSLLLHPETLKPTFHSQAGSALPHCQQLLKNESIWNGGVSEKGTLLAFELSPYFLRYHLYPWPLSRVTHTAHGKPLQLSNLQPSIWGSACTAPLTCWALQYWP